MHCFAKTPRGLEDADCLTHWSEALRFRIRDRVMPWTCWARGHLEQGICDFGHSRVVVLLARDSIVAETGEKAFAPGAARKSRGLIRSQKFSNGVLML
jgi:hypothetical protein